MGVTRETLENGNVLKALILQFLNERTEQHLFAVLNCLRDSFVWIPGHIQMNEADMQKFEALLTPEQKSKLDAAKQKREEMHKNSGKHGFMPHGHRGLPKSENIESE